MATEWVKLSFMPLCRGDKKQTQIFWCLFFWCAYLSKNLPPTFLQYIWLLSWIAHEVQCCIQLMVWTVNLCYVRKISPCWIPCLSASWQPRGKRRYSERVRMETSILRLKKLKSLTLQNKQGRHNNGEDTEERKSVFSPFYFSKTTGKPMKPRRKWFTSG